MIALVGLGAVAVTLLLILVRAALGPTSFDRILAVNAFGTGTVLLISLMTFVLNRTDFIDLALVYALINFIGTIAILRFHKLGSFADDGGKGDAAP